MAEIGLVPNIVVGDLDGIDEQVRASLAEGTIVQVTNQDTTDFQKCLAYCRERGATEIAVLNYEGRRVDHMLSGLFAASAQGGIRFVGADAQAQFLAQGRHRLATSAGIRVSLIPLEPTRVVAASGLEYDPTGIELTVGGRDGISNRALGDEVSLEIGAGRLIAFVERFEGEPCWK